MKGDAAHLSRENEFNKIFYIYDWLTSYCEEMRTIEALQNIFWITYREKTFLLDGREICADFLFKEILIKSTSKVINYIINCSKLNSKK